MELDKASIACRVGARNDVGVGGCFYTAGIGEAERLKKKEGKSRGVLAL